MTETDLVTAALEALQPEPAHAPARQSLAQARLLRAKILGALLRQRRQAAQASLEDCANFLQLSPPAVEAWEYGEESPSLPQFELLSSYLAGEPTPGNQADYVLLRGRVIGVLLRMARDKKAMSADAVAIDSALDADCLRAVELGESDIPLSDLTALAQTLRLDLRELVDAPAADFTPAPAPANPAIDDSQAALRDFEADSDNAAFIRLALAFRHIPAEDLHRIADALFAIINAPADQRPAAS